jgi:putative membrane protein
MSGAIAICAMILPGISGSFILLLLGSYTTIFGAIGHFTDDIAGNSPIIAAFGIGAVIGLLSFSKLLKYLFQSHRAITIAILTGFMIGSLNKVWPWKEVISTRVNSKGEEVPLLQNNIAPGDFLELTGSDPQIALAIGMAVLGVLIVYLLSRVDSMKNEH